MSNAHADICATNKQKETKIVRQRESGYSQFTEKRNSAMVLWRDKNSDIVLWYLTSTSITRRDSRTCGF